MNTAQPTEHGHHIEELARVYLRLSDDGTRWEIDSPSDDGAPLFGYDGGALHEECPDCPDPAGGEALTDPDLLPDLPTLRDLPAMIAEHIAEPVQPGAVPSLVGKVVASVSEVQMMGRDTFKDTVTWTQHRITFTDGSTVTYADDDADVYDAAQVGYWYEPGDGRCEPIACDSTEAEHVHDTDGECSSCGGDAHCAGWSGCEDRAEVPCAYCGKPTPPAAQASAPWYHPEKGRVTNCRTCAGIVKCPRCGEDYDGAERHAKPGDPCLDCEDKPDPLTDPATPGEVEPTTPGATGQSEGNAP